MKLCKFSGAVLALAASLAALPTSASAFTYDESINGDLSDDRNAPTHFTLSVGSNTLTSTTVRDEIDYVRLSLPAGMSLDQMILELYSGLDGKAFVGVQSGTTFTQTPETANPAGMLGYAHFGPEDGDTPGSDLLPKISQGGGAIGFTPPLTGSDYTFWLQQTGLNASTYTLDFIVSVPEPASASVLAMGALGLLRRSRRRGN